MNNINNFCIVHGTFKNIKFCDEGAKMNKPTPPNSELKKHDLGNKQCFCAPVFSIDNDGTIWHRY